MDRGLSGTRLVERASDVVARATRIRLDEPVEESASPAETVRCATAGEGVPSEVPIEVPGLGTPATRPATRDTVRVVGPSPTAISDGTEGLGLDATGLTAGEPLLVVAVVEAAAAVTQPSRIPPPVAALTPFMGVLPREVRAAAVHRRGPPPIITRLHMGYEALHD